MLGALAVVLALCSGTAWSVSLVDNHGVNNVIPSYPFELGNASFSVIAPPVFLARGATIDDVGANVADRVMFVDFEDYVALDVLAWSIACQQYRCSAMAIYTSMPIMQSGIELMAWIYRSGRAPFTNLPIVVIGRHDESTWTSLKEFNRNIIVDTFPNPAGRAVTGSTTALSCVLLFCTTVLTLLTLFKFVSIALDTKGHLRRISLLHFTLIIGNLMYVIPFQFAFAVNLAFYNGQLYSFGVFIFLFYAICPFSGTARMVGLFQVLKSKISNSTDVKKGAKIFFALYFFVQSALIILQYIFAFIGVVAGKLPFRFGFVYGIIVATPMIMSIIGTKQVVDLVKSLFGNTNVGVEGATRTRWFAFRMIFVVMTGLGISISAIVFLSIQSQSALSFITSWISLQIVMAMLAISGQVMLQSKPSIADKWLHRALCGCRLVSSIMARSTNSSAKKPMANGELKLISPAPLRSSKPATIS